MWIDFISLSAQLAVGVREGNPNIVNLNDPYRSTKVAELYSELYDNEWTTAFDRIEKDKPDGRYVIDMLLDILIVWTSTNNKHCWRDQHNTITFLVINIHVCEVLTNYDVDDLFFKILCLQLCYKFCDASVSDQWARLEFWFLDKVNTQAFLTKIEVLYYY